MKSITERIKERNKHFTPAQLEEKRERAIKDYKKTNRKERNK